MSRVRRRAYLRAGSRATVPADGVGPWLAETYAQISTYSRGLEIATAGPPDARYTFRAGRTDVEAGFPVSRAFRGQGPMQPSGLPGGTVVITVHLGPHEALEDGCAPYMRWLPGHACAAIGGRWEVYYTDPAQEPDSSRWLPEVVAPYANAHAGTPG